MPQIVIQKTAYDFHNTEVQIGTVKGALGIVDGLEAIKYTATFDREKMRGSARLPQDYTDGEGNYDGSFSMQMYWWRYIINFMNANGMPRATTEMTFSVNYYKPGYTLQTDTFFRCRFKKIDFDFKRGVDTLMVPVDLDMLNVFQNGVDDFGNKLAG